MKNRKKKLQEADPARGSLENAKRVWLNCRDSTRRRASWRSLASTEWGPIAELRKPTTNFDNHAGRRRASDDGGVDQVFTAEDEGCWFATALQLTDQ